MTLYYPCQQRKWCCFPFVVEKDVGDDPINESLSELLYAIIASKVLIDSKSVTQNKFSCLSGRYFDLITEFSVKDRIANDVHT